MIPSAGRIVHYCLNKFDAAEINRRRQDARASQIAAQSTGAIVHCGNVAREGDVLPMLIVKVWASPEDVTEGTAINGQVFLDGNDTLWATSRHHGDGPGEWFEPPRV